MGTVSPVSTDLIKHIFHAFNEKQNYWRKTDIVKGQ